MPDPSLKPLGDVPKNLDKALWDFLDKVKHNLAIISGQKGIHDSTGVTFGDLDDEIASLPDSQGEEVANLYHIPKSYDKDMSEILTRIFVEPTPKSYDAAISQILSSAFHVPSAVSHEKRIENLEGIIHALQSPIPYDADIKRLEQLIVSGAFNPGGEENLNIYTGLGENKITKDLTFSNDSGALTLFTVTGDVWVNILPVITTDVLSAAVANVRLGVVGNTDAMIVDSVSTALLARAIWVDQTPDYEIETTERIRGYFITDGNDVILTADAQVDSGVIRFYCFWSPLSSDGNVVVA